MLVETFSVENIQDESKLYYRVHKGYYINNSLIPGVFRELGVGCQKSMSTDWEKYSNAIESRMRANNPEDNGIVHFIAGRLRKVNLSVQHAPLIDNRAHTDVKGINMPIEKDTELRAKLMDEFTWDIRPNDPILELP